MSSTNKHRLLKRQLRKANFNFAEQEKLEVFLNQVDQAYKGADEDYIRLEKILEISSKELYKLNQSLKSDVVQKNSEVKETKKQLELVVNNVKNVIFQTTASGEYTFLNQAWEDVLGVEVKDSLGKKFSDFFHHIDSESITAIQQFIDTSGRQGQFNHIMKVVTCLEEHKWIEVTYQYTFDENGEANGTIGSFVDVTSIKQAEIALKIAKETAEAANESKSHFLNIMSHEIRTPLNSIIGLTNIMILEEHMQEQSENLHALKFSGEHLLHLINDILDFNKIMAGKVNLEEKEFSIESVLDGLRRNFQPLAIEKGIRFKIIKDEDLPMALVGDKTRLYQILNNLVSNAIKFTSDGKVVLSLELIKIENKVARILFEVSDSGIGIKEENVDKIFQLFEQADQSITRKFGGTGLGLAICRKLLNAMDSEIEVESIEGKGSTFKFEIAYTVSENFEQFNKSMLADLSSSFSGLDGKKVLIAEDYTMNVLVLKQFFDKWGLKYEIGKNGQEALDLLAIHKFDAVFMDLQMPIMDGYEATKRIRAMQGDISKTPIIALTATTQQDIKEKALKAGVDAFISKPFNPIHLFNTTKEIIG